MASQIYPRHGPFKRIPQLGDNKIQTSDSFNGTQDNRTYSINTELCESVHVSDKIPNVLKNIILFMNMHLKNATHHSPAPFAPQWVNFDGDGSIQNGGNCITNALD